MSTLINKFSVSGKEIYWHLHLRVYSKRFLAEHEAGILIHKAATQAFEELGYGKDKKLPTVKALQVEYAQLLAEKEKAYGEYRKARDDMKVLQTAKYNVDRILNMEEEHDEEKEKEHDQRWADHAQKRLQNA